LPDFHYNTDYGGQDPHGFMPRNAVVDYLEAFAATFEPNLREHTSVIRLVEVREGSFWIDTTAGSWTCEQVVIATGGNDRPYEPDFAFDLDPRIVQMHSVDYRNPAQIPVGATLIVGTGQSGVHILEDFVRAGREVHLAVGSAPRSPRKYRGRDVSEWLYDAGHYGITIDAHPDPLHARTMSDPYMTGRDGGKEIDLRHWHAEYGVQLYGSLSNMEGLRAEFRPDLKQSLDNADAAYLGIRETIDTYIAQNNIDAPEEPPFKKIWEPGEEITEIDLHALGISSVLWANGFRPNYSWVDLDIFDADGNPKFDRGVTDVAGLHFVGLDWLNTWGSGRFLGIEEDSAYIADQIEGQLTRSRKRAVA
jgi:putative flavoprotein involved in K+ transport